MTSLLRVCSLLACLGVYYSDAHRSPASHEYHLTRELSVPLSRQIIDSVPRSKRMQKLESVVQELLFKTFSSTELVAVRNENQKPDYVTRSAPSKSEGTAVTSEGTQHRLPEVLANRTKWRHPGFVVDEKDKRGFREESHSGRLRDRPTRRGSVPWLLGRDRRGDESQPAQRSDEAARRGGFGFDLRETKQTVKRYKSTAYDCIALFCGGLTDRQRYRCILNNCHNARH